MWFIIEDEGLWPARRVAVLKGPQLGVVEDEAHFEDHKKDIERQDEERTAEDRHVEGGSWETVLVEAADTQQEHGGPEPEARLEGVLEHVVVHVGPASEGA